MNKLKGFLHRFFFFSQDNNACIFTAYYEGGNMWVIPWNLYL